MQEEQRSLSSIQTVSVCHLLMDRCVRWQLISIVVMNIGMQLSGIDAVSVQRMEFVSVFVSLCSHVCKECLFITKIQPIAFFSSCATPIRTASCLYIIFPHAATECLSRGQQDHASLSPFPIHMCNPT